MPAGKVMQRIDLASGRLRRRRPTIPRSTGAGPPPRPGGSCTPGPLGSRNAVGPAATPRTARLGCGGVCRLFEVTREISRHLEQALGDRPCWYLNNMVVREHLRGKGIGSQLLREQLPAVARMEPLYSVALSTQRPENVTFYERLGFRPVLDGIIGSGPAAFRNWIMVFAPAAQHGGAWRDARKR